MELVKKHFFVVLFIILNFLKIFENFFSKIFQILFIERALFRYKLVVLITNEEFN